MLVRVITGIILITLIGGIGLFTIIKYVSKKQNLPEHLIKKQKIEMQNTEFTVYDLNTKAITLSSLKNKVVLINFWATWCAPCVKELPSLNKLAEYYPKNLVILAVSNEQTDNIKNFLMAFPQFNDNFIPANVGKEQMQATFSIQAVPETYVLNKKGKLVEKIIGPRQWDSLEWRNKIKNLIETPP